MYTGLMNGQIVKVDVAGDIHKIVQMGSQNDENICSKSNYFKAFPFFNVLKFKSFFKVSITI